MRKAGRTDILVDMLSFLSTATAKKEPESPAGRLLAVGDIHGCLRQLKNLMEKVHPAVDDRIVFLGDYIDRGPDSRGVIDYLLDFGERFPSAVFLKGNHEEMFLDFIAGRNQMLYLMNGGEATLENYREGDKLRFPRSHIDFLTGLQKCYETDRFIFVHAGLRPGIPLNAQQEKDLLWIREEFTHSDYNWGKAIVFGHTPRLDVSFSPSRIAIDTGAVYGRALSCCDVERQTCWSA